MGEMTYSARLLALFDIQEKSGLSKKIMMWTVLKEFDCGAEKG